MKPSGDDLVVQAVQGDREALGVLLKRCTAPARSALAGNIPARWQSVLSEDDVIQQTYADAIRSISQCRARTEQSFSAWLAQTAKRNLLNAIEMLEREKRGGGRIRVEPSDSDSSYFELYETITGGVSTPSRNVGRKEAKAALERAIGQLPRTYAQVVVMYDLEGRPLKDVADSVRRSPGAVCMLRSRAHLRLAEIMGTASDFISRR